ncbi:LmbE family protein [Methanosarcina barkeri CM1]|uniref:LmbE family protein n=1 Tax=Methanosarcina barkeri CM1 TaxID=796385 RepID=A0A0G3CII1_METBA|nr:LmbE family protein [Methanosarcina barkeri CM1]
MFDLANVTHLINYIIFTIVIIFILTKQLPLERMVRRSRIIIWLVLIINIFSAILQFFCLISPDSNILYQLAADCLGIIGQSILLIGILWMKLIVEPSPKPRKILVIGAHPDDIEIACGGSIAELSDAGNTIMSLIVSKGERGGNSSSRLIEATKSAEFLGINKVEIMDFPDTKLDQFILEISKKIEIIVNELKPDMVFTHSIHDLHQDHRAVHDATLRACRNLSTILCYESPSTTQDFQPNVFINIEQYVDIKIESIQKHKDQNKKKYVQPEQVYGKAIFRGAQAKLGEAEGFEAIRINLQI